MNIGGAASVISQEKAATRDQLADFTRDLRMLPISLMALCIGVISAAIAYVLVLLIGLITNLSFYQRFSTTFTSPAGNHLGYLVILVPAVGGLVIGLMARYGTEQIRGHGIPEALEAILILGSRMTAKVAVLKPLSSAISIGTGGPFGAEGPIIMTGGACGSLFAQAFTLSAAERRTLLVAGAAGGMSAIFNSPVSATLLAVELLLFEWRPRSFIPVALASVVAAAVRVPLLGSGCVFPAMSRAALGGNGLAFALLVGLIAGLGSGLLTVLVYGFEDLFRKLPIHWMWWPVIGGLCVGVGGLISPRSLGVGYDTIDSLLHGQVMGGEVIGLLVVKTLIWAIALGSGTSGGVLAPLLIIGGALGAIEARWIPIGNAGLWSLISMAAIMGGTMRSPLTAVIFALETTREINLLPALLMSCAAAHGLTVLLLRRSILTEKVARRGHHLMREYAVDPLSMVRISEVMDREPPTIRQEVSLSEFADRIARGDARLTREATLVVDEEDRLVGIVSRGDVLRHLGGDPRTNATVGEICSRNLIVCHPDELVQQAVTRMLDHNVARLPVVSRDDPRRLLGYFGRAEVLLARTQRLREEYVREHGWGRHLLRGLGSRRAGGRLCSEPAPRDQVEG